MNSGASVRTLDDARDSFRRVFDLPDDAAVDDAEYRVTEIWDSVAHMALVADLEDTFDVMFDTEEIIAMSSFSEALRLLAVHGVTLAE